MKKKKTETSFSDEAHGELLLAEVAAVLAKNNALNGDVVSIGISLIIGVFNTWAREDPSQKGRYLRLANDTCNMLRKNLLEVIDCPVTPTMGEA